MFTAIRKDKIGIMPIGALSIAFASYIQGVDTFIESKKNHYKIGDKLKIYLDNEIREIILTEENYTNNISLLIKPQLNKSFPTKVGHKKLSKPQLKLSNGRMPEVILFSPPNHRLLSTLDEIIITIGKILELRHYRDDIDKIDNYDTDNFLPKIVMLSNGIYYDDIINYINKKFEHLEDSTKEKIIGNFIRATTHQTGIRIKSGTDIVFKPGTKSNVTIAGGSEESRKRIITLFKKYGYTIFEMDEVRRIEFDKAIINLSTNGVQLSLIFDDKNQIQQLTYGDIISNEKMQELCKKIIHTMVSIGVKSGIYKSTDIPEEELIDKIYTEEWEKLKERSRMNNTHIFSSIAIVLERYRSIYTDKYRSIYTDKSDKYKEKTEGTCHKIPPLEESIIDYLIKLSKENNLYEEKIVIEALRDNIEHVCEKLSC
jgi:ketopantoate reductase